MVIRNSCAPSKTVDLSVAEIAGPVGMLLDRPLRHRPLVRALTGPSCCGGCMIRSRANGPDDASLLPGRAGASGGRFAALLAERAAAGVKVRVLCDWFGCWSTPQRLFRQLQGCGGEV